ncbi:hypothetical protein [Bacillus alkalisoli]|uniref:hypothetical protein n=1 Tax=Bacillus alkalisoli TaxID=2011008 RepID=UPI000C230428|nr:hypothetical protein [Bacillus alkalisoli]
MKKLFVIGAFLLVVGVGLYLVKGQMSIVTSQKAIFSVVSVDNMREMVINRYEDNALVTVRDKAVIDRIVNDLSGMELKRENGTPPVGDYAVRIYSDSGEQLGMELHKSGEYLWLNSSKHGGQLYKVVKGTDFLGTIEEELEREN